MKRPTTSNAAPRPLRSRGARLAQRSRAVDAPLRFSSGENAARAMLMTPPGLSPARIKRPSADSTFQPPGRSRLRNCSICTALQPLAPSSVSGLERSSRPSTVRWPGRRGRPRGHQLPGRRRRACRPGCAGLSFRHAAATSVARDTNSLTQGKIAFAQLEITGTVSRRAPRRLYPAHRFKPPGFRHDTTPVAKARRPPARLKGWPLVSRTARAPRLRPLARLKKLNAQVPQTAQSLRVAASN